MTDPGVLDRERQRRTFWLRRNLSDPLALLAAERVARRQAPDYRDPRRAALDAYFATHPDDRPTGW